MQATNYERVSYFCQNKVYQILFGFETAIQRGDHFTAVISSRLEQSNGLH